MKKPVFILLAVLAAAAVAYFGCFHFATRQTREMLSDEDNMMWLRTEFALTDEQARAIAKLQADYEPRCMEMCARIAKSSARLQKLMQASEAMSPELEAAVREVGQTKADCHAATLAQAFAISAHMTPAQAVRYRAMIAERVLTGCIPPNTAPHR